MGGQLLRRTDHRTRLLRTSPLDLPAVMLAVTASMVAVIFAAIATRMVLHWEGARSAGAYEQELSTCLGVSLQELFADSSAPIPTASTLKYLYTTSAGSDRFTIDRRSHLSLEEYRETYDGKWPVVITDVVNQWNAAKWNREFFAHRYSTKPVFTKTSMNGKLSDVEGQLMPLSSFFGCCINSSSDSSTVVDDRRPCAKWMYVEDEHFVRCTPELLNDIGTCLYTEDDWFRLLLPADLRPWHAMLLWGSRGSRSSLHVDPYNWTGTLAVLSGRKRWKVAFRASHRQKQKTRQTPPPGGVAAIACVVQNLSEFQKDARNFSRFVCAGKILGLHLLHRSLPLFSATLSSWLISHRDSVAPGAAHDHS